MPLPIHSVVLSFTAAALLILSGCGGGSPQSSNTDPAPTTNPVASLAAPAAVAATTDAGQVTLRWDPVEGAASYAIFMDAPAAGAALASKVADAVTSPYTVNGLARGQTYLFTIVAITADGNEGEGSAAIPVRLPMTATALVTGAEHSCALLSDGAVKCWGRNNASQLGSAIVDYSASPVAVPGVANAKAISAAGQHSCAVLSDGSMQCWGTYGEGAAAVMFASPIVIGGVATAVSVASARDTDCALLSDGTVMCFNPVPVPIGTSLTATIPSELVGWDPSLFGPVPAFAPSLSKAPALMLVGTMVSGVADVKQVVAGTDFTCALLNDGTVTCWSGVTGRLGSIAPRPLPNIAGATAITARGGQACVLMPAGVQCWNMSRYGCMYPPDGGVRCWMRGDYRAPLIFTFLQIQSALSEVKAIAVGTDVSPSAYFAIVNGGAVYEWNVLPLNAPGFSSQQSSLTTPTPVSSPVLVTDLVNVATIANGNAHGCALLLSGDVACWGSNQYGQVGNGEISDGVALPTFVTTISQ